MDPSPSDISPCKCSYVAKDYEDALRHLRLMSEREADGHGFKIDEWKTISIFCGKCKTKFNSEKKYEDHICKL